MNYLIIQLIFSAFLLHLVCGDNFPSDVQKCQKGDGACIAATVTSILKNKIHGDENLKLTSLSPMLIEKLNIKQGANSPVNVELNVTNGKLTGLETGRCSKVSGFNDINGPHELIIKSKYLTILGDYQIDGKVLILPIRGVGKTNITVVNPIVKVTFDGKPIMQNGQLYMDVMNLKLDVKIKRLYIVLTNLFNGDQALSNNMNLFLNDNWQDIYGELKKPVEAAFTVYFTRTIRDVFRVRPYDELFL